MFATKVKPESVTVIANSAEMSDLLTGSQEEQLYTVLMNLYNRVIKLEDVCNQQQQQINNLISENTILKNQQEKPNVPVFVKEFIQPEIIDTVNSVDTLINPVNEPPTFTEEEQELINKINNLPFEAEVLNEVLTNVKLLIDNDEFNKAVEYYQETVLKNLDKSMYSSFSTEKNFELLEIPFSWCYTDKDIDLAYKKIEQRILDTGKGILNLQQIVAAYNSLLEFNKIPF
jgi:hypothetical protein